MDSGNLNEFLCRVATHLYEQGEREALRLLLTAEADFRDESYSMDCDGYDTVEPAVFTLYANGDLVESSNRNAPESAQIAKAFSAVYGGENYVRVSASEPRPERPLWVEMLKNRLPAAAE